MTEVGEGECKSQKEVRAPTTDNDMNECINKYAKDHIKAPNEWNEDIHIEYGRCNTLLLQLIFSTDT